MAYYFADTFGFNFYANQTKSNYGSETVSGINCDSHVNLNGTTVQGNIKVDGYLTGTNAKIKNLEVGGFVTLTNSNISDWVTIGGYFIASKCNILGAVTVGSHAEINDCTLTSLTAGSKVEINHSTITDTLTCTSNNLILTASEINTIILKGANCANAVFGGGKYMIQASHIDAIGDNATVIHNYPSGRSFGASKYNIQCSNIGVIGNNTQVVNTSHGTFINGLPSEEYKRQNAYQAPQVSKQMIELRDCQVQNIIFDGKGEVVLVGTSKLTGSITNGKIKN